VTHLKVVVIGAGAIGLCSAYYLTRAGAEVVLLDQRAPGAGASRRNAGWIVPSMSAPVSAPGVLGQSLRWMLRKDSPLYVRPSLDPDFLRFMAGMLRRCRTPTFERGIRNLVELNSRTFELFDELASDGVRFECHRDGVLQLFTTQKSLDSHAAELETIANLGGSSVEILDSRSVSQRLPHASDLVVGGIDCPEERYLDPDSFVDALALACREQGVEIESDERIENFQTDGIGRVTAATGRQRWAADKFVVATGAWSNQLLRPLLKHPPIQAGKGYGYDLQRTNTGPQRTVYLSEAKVAVTSLTNRVRIAGTMAFGGLDESIDKARASGMLSAARDYFVDWPPENDMVPWAGMRPMTPDGLPLIGPLRSHPNLIIATGHSMLGITLAPVTGDLVARTVMDGRTPSSALPFSVERFRRR
jgi:D-amino-acid dehydrogenase